MNAVHSFHSPVFDRPAPRKLKTSFWIAVILAAALHVAGGAYLLHQKFSIAVTEPDEGKITIVDTVKPKPPEPPKPVTPDKPVPQPPKPVTPHETTSTVPDDVETTPIAPSKPVDDDGSKTPPVITEPPAKPGVGTEAGPAYVTARWTRFPDSAALLSYYPERGANDEVEGEATVECTVTDGKGRVTCIVLSEAPKGYGFGKATARMVQDKGRVDVSQGDVQVGSKLRTTVKWTLQ